MEKSLDYWPLKMAMYFLLITEILFFFGPFTYYIPNNTLLFFYLAILNFSFFLGYKKGVSKFVPSCSTTSILSIKTLIILGFIIICYDFVHCWSIKGMSISVSAFIDALLNPGNAYYAETVIQEETSYIMLLLSPISWAVVPLGIASWDKIPDSIKAIVISSVIISIVKWLGLGMRKGVIDILIITFFCLVAKNEDFLFDNNKKRAIRLVIISFIAIFLTYFTFSNISRGGGESLSELNTMTVGAEIRPMFSFMPSWLLVALAGIVGYLCQGYYALGLALDIGIKPIAPLGMSWFTIALAKKFGYDPTVHTYMYDLEQYGIGMSLNWHSIYVWLANDFTFIGVPIVIFFIGYLFAQTWMDAKHGSNIWAFPIFSLMVIMIFYFFANNQVLSFSFIPFLFWFAYYKFSRIQS